MIKRSVLLVVVALVSSSCAALGFSGECGGTEVIANFEQVGDLVEASNVQSADVVIGTVDQIELDDWTARVTMCLDAAEKIPADVEAVVRTTSLLGEKFVDLRAKTSGPPYLEDGAVLDVDQTSKATELEDVFARLGTVLGAGNLQQLNRFTSAQARILENRADELRTVLRELRTFTETLAVRKDDIARGIDSLDSVARTILADRSTLEDFLASFADSSDVLADQREGLEDLLVALDRFTNISIRLLDATEEDVNRQFDELRPVLRTVVANSANVRETLQTLATFTQWWPETMPGDYLQLDVCQPPPDAYGQGVTCPQSDAGRTARDGRVPARIAPQPVRVPSNSLELILEQPLRGGS